MPTYDKNGALLISLAGVVLDHEHSAPGDGGPLAVGVTDTDLTAGSVWFAGVGGLLQQDNANLFWDDANNRLGVGTDAPDTPFHVLSIVQPQVKIEFDATNYMELSHNTMNVKGNDLIVENNDGSEVLRLKRNDVGINDPAPTAQLSVDQSSGTGAKPVLTLDQADVDYVLAKIIATAAAASADRTLVADSDYGTPGALVGWIQIEIQDDGNRVADADYYIPFYAAPT